MSIHFREQKGEREMGKENIGEKKHQSVTSQTNPDLELNPPSFSVCDVPDTKPEESPGQGNILFCVCWFCSEKRKFLL